MTTPLNVERDEITNVATIFETTADAIEDQADAATHCTFDAARAGRAYAASGTAVHGGYLKVATSLQEWTRQSQSIAASMRHAVHQYGTSDDESANTLTEQH